MNSIEIKFPMEMKVKKNYLRAPDGLTRKDAAVRKTKYTKDMCGKKTFFVTEYTLNKLE